jgi:outer membrane protein assembly factor BamB
MLTTLAERTMLGVVPAHGALIGPWQVFQALLPLILVGLLVVALVAVAIWLVVRQIRRGRWRAAIRTVLVGLAIDAGLCVAFLAWCLAPPPPLPEVPVAESAAGWMAWRGGPERRGYVPGSAEPVHGDHLWSFVDEAADIRTVYSSPAIVGNRVYVTTAKWEVFKRTGSLCCLDADTGRLVWRYGKKYLPTFSSPAVSGKYLVVGEGLHETSDARVFCFDVEAGEVARAAVKLWEYRTGSHVESSPCIADGRAYIGAGEDGFYCFQLEPNADGTAKVLWHLEGGEGSRYPDCESSPVVHDGKVYFGLGIGGNAVVCIDALTGQELWRVATSYPVFSAPSISGGKLYVGMGNGDFVNRAESLGFPPAGEVWCIDLATHRVDWKFIAERTVLGTVAVDGDRLYFGSRDKRLYCVSTAGHRLGEWNAGSPILTSPAVGPDRVYIAPTGNRLVALDKTTLTPAWEAELGGPQSFGISSPVVARGHVYIGSMKEGMLCIGSPGAVGSDAAPDQ